MSTTKMRSKGLSLNIIAAPLDIALANTQLVRW